MAHEYRIWTSYFHSLGDSISSNINQCSKPDPQRQLPGKSDRESLDESIFSAFEASCVRTSVISGGHQVQTSDLSMASTRSDASVSLPFLSRNPRR